MTRTFKDMNDEPKSPAVWQNYSRLVHLKYRVCMCMYDERESRRRAGKKFGKDSHGSIHFSAYCSLLLCIYTVRALPLAILFFFSHLRLIFAEKVYDDCFVRSLFTTLACDAWVYCFFFLFCSKFFFYDLIYYFYFLWENFYIRDISKWRRTISIVICTESRQSNIARATFGIADTFSGIPIIYIHI